MRRALLALSLLSLTACGGGEGAACEPFPNAAEKVFSGCADALVCVGTKGQGRCVRPDQPSEPDAATIPEGLSKAERLTPR